MVHLTNQNVFDTGCCIVGMTKLSFVSKIKTLLECDFSSLYLCSSELRFVFAMRLINVTTHGSTEGRTSS